MRAALYVYVGLYALFGAWTVAEDARDGEPLWETLGDFLLFSLGFAGMVLYRSGAADPDLKALWKFVAVALAAGQLLLNLHVRRKVLRGGGGPGRGGPSQAAILLTDLTAVALLLPCLYMNVAFAYGPFS